MRCLDERENPSFDRAWKVIPGSHDAGQIGREIGAGDGTRRARHQYGHLARVVS